MSTVDELEARVAALEAELTRLRTEARLNARLAEQESARARHLEQTLATMLRMQGAPVPNACGLEARRLDDGGRRVKLTAEVLIQAWHLHQRDAIPVREVAKRTQCSQATMKRFLGREYQTPSALEAYRTLGVKPKTFTEFAEERSIAHRS